MKLQKKTGLDDFVDKFLEYSVPEWVNDQIRQRLLENGTDVSDIAKSYYQKLKKVKKKLYLKKSSLK